LQKKWAGLTLYSGRGCPECHNTGYRGRIGLFEVLPITPTIREMILNRASAAEIEGKAVEEGMMTLRQDGLLKIEKGITTWEEVLRETSA